MAPRERDGKRGKDAKEKDDREKGVKGAKEAKEAKEAWMQTSDGQAWKESKVKPPADIELSAPLPYGAAS